MPDKLYRFVGRKGPFGMSLLIPYGAIVKLRFWGPKRKVIIEYDGQVFLTMGYYLRRLKEENKQN